MGTLKKTVAKAAPKKTVAKKVELTPPKKAPVKKKVEEQFAMPMEVKEWIDQASSRMKSMQGKIERLETEIKELKSYKKWAEHRILGSAPE